MEKRALGETGLTIAPVVFGGNVFGWTIDEKTSFEVLDAFVDHGFDTIDTADVYSVWGPGNKGGESETIIGNWLKARPGMRERVTIFTKVGFDLRQPGKVGLSARWIRAAVEDSLTRLGIETIDLYFAHLPDGTPYEETLGAFDALLRAGKVRAIGASNHDATMLKDALAVSAAKGLPRYQVVQPEYNLYARSGFEGPLQDLCVAEKLGVVVYYSLASGFLTGKYRTAEDLAQSAARGGKIGTYLNERGLRILAALDAVSAAHGTTPAAVALAWLLAQPGVTAPIASATRISQVKTFAAAADLRLTDAEVAALTDAGR